MNMKKKSVLALLLSGGLSLSFATGNVSAQEIATEDTGSYTLEQTSESTMVMDLENIDVSINGHNNVTLEDEYTNQTVSLPSTGVDKEGNEVDIEYKKDGEDLIIGAVNPDLSPEIIEHEDGTAVGGWRCVAGTAGSVGTGALGGAAGGSVIPGVGTAGGGIAGGVSGGLVGAATFC